MYLARKHTDMSFPEIGRFLGNKDHSTVFQACRRIDRLLSANSAVRWDTNGALRQKSICPIVKTWRSRSSRDGEVKPELETRSPEFVAQ